MPEPSGEDSMVWVARVGKCLSGPRSGKRQPQLSCLPPLRRPISLNGNPGYPIPPRPLTTNE